MSRPLQIPTQAAGQRLDVALAEALGQTRSQIQRLLKDHKITIDGQTQAAKWLVQGGETVIVEEVAISEQPDPPKLKILYEDDDVLAVNKPAGLVVHATESGGAQPTVADFAQAHGVHDPGSDRPGIVHRLDKDTSGVMLLAKNPSAKEYLQQQFRQRKVKKCYLALVRGRLKDDEATISLPIDRSRKTPIKRAVQPQGRPAVTHYRVIERLTGACLIEIGLETGRTHQIRVHFAHLGHPVIGDTLYGEPAKGLNRQFLHAEHIEFTAPSGRLVTIDSPLPAELEAYLKSLRSAV